MKPQTKIEVNPRNATLQKKARVKEDYYRINMEAAV
jgi:hypothetical protein